MIGPYTRLPVADNSGAILVGCINVPKLLRRLGPRAGDTLTASVKENIFKKRIKKKSRIISKSQIVKVLVLVTARQMKRIGNFFISSSLNRVLLLNQYDLPYGTRLFGPIFREVRKKIKYKKVISLSKLLI